MTGNVNGGACGPQPIQGAPRRLKVLLYNPRAVFFTMLLVSGNTMAQSVRERTGELGVGLLAGVVPGNDGPPVGARADF